MNKKSKILAIAGGGTMSVVVGVFAFFMMVASPFVLGSNVDPVTKMISANAPIKVTFSGWMNKEKTQSAFKIEPATKGTFTWEDNSLIFTPSELMKIGDRYTITIGIDAENTFGKKLLQAYWIDFIIAGPPQAIFSAPNNITVGKDAKVVVMFNQPMVTLTDLDNQKTDNVLLNITPVTEGKVKWIDTSSLEFVPKDHLMYSSQYAVTINKGSTSLDGGKTEKEYAFSFETIHPKMVTFDPVNNYELAGSTTPLKITFNQPIDLTSFEKNLSSTPATKFSFSHDVKDPNTVILIPEGGLKMKTDYKLIVGKNTKGEEGTFMLGEDLVWEFKTVGEVTLINSEPKDKDKGADVYNVTLYFSNPMDLKSFKDKVIVTPDVKESVPEDAWTDSETAVTVTGDFQYSTPYTLTVKAGVKDLHGQELKKDVTISFKTKERDPYFKIAKKDIFNMFNGYQNPVYPLKAINLDSVDAYLCSLPQDAYLERAFTYTDQDPINCMETKSWNISTKGDRNKIVTAYIDLKEILGHPITSGIYFLRVSSDKIMNDWERRDYVTFFVSKTSLTMKMDKEKLLVWATDLGNGQPISDMSVSLYGDTQKVITTGKTDKQGLFTTKMNLEGNVYVVGERVGDIAFISRYWTNGIAPWDFGLSQDWRQKTPVFAYLYTERPIYRPEQKVFFKGIVRVDNDAKYSIPALQEVPVIITDANYTEVFNQKIKVSKNGTFFGEFLLDKNASTGQYQMHASLGDNDFYQNFWVEEYKKPEFNIDVTPESKHYGDGDTLKASIKASYYFGGALKNKEVTWSINGSDYYFPDYDGEWYSFSDSNNFWYCFDGCTPDQSVVTQGTGTLDANGMLTISTPLSLKEKKLDQMYMLEATVKDSNDQTVSNRIPIYIHKGGYYLGIRSDSYSFTKGDEGDFKAVLLDYSHNPVAGKTLAVSLYERTWNQTQKKNIDGEFYTEYEPKDTLVETKNVTTDTTGKASGKFSFTKGGEMVIKAVVKDDQSREMTSSTSVYVGDETYVSWYSANDSRMDLIPDKQEYKVGDTAKILIKSPFENVKALVSYERRNILEYKVIDLVSTSQTIEIPITDKMIPNMYVSVIAMKGGGISKTKIQDDMALVDAEIEKLENTPDMDPLVLETQKKELMSKKENLTKQLVSATDKVSKPDFRVGYTTLRVDTKSKNVNMDLKTDKERYLPREKVTMTVKTMDHTGKPISAEVSLSVVDQSVLALKNKEEDILKFFYGKKDLGVETASAMTIFTDTVLVKLKQKGGDGMAEADMPKNVRGVFKDTAYFKADVVTNNNGEGTVSFDLPDNLTTWKVLAVAVTNDTLVGSKDTSFMTTKELIVRPVLPRFFRIGDEVEVGAVIQNGQTKDDTVNVTMEVLDNNLTMSGSKSQSVQIQKDNEQKVMWKVKAGNGKSTTIKISAKGNNAEDILQLTLPILPYATPEVVATSGETDISRTENLRLSNNVSNNAGNVTITVANTLLTNVTKGLESMIHYPYGCAEQVMSTLLSTVSTTVLFDKLGMPLPEINIEKGTVLENEKIMSEKDPKKKVAMMVEVGLQKIYSFQRADGGWGYWVDSTESYGHLSAYVLYGLNRLKESGYSIDEGVIKKGTAFLTSYIKAKSLYATGTNKDGTTAEGKEIAGYKANERMFMLYVLSTLKKGDVGLTNNLYDIREKLNLYAKGYLLLTLQNTGDTEKATKVYNELIASVTEDNTARTVHFEEKTNDVYGMNTDLRTTAIVLQGIIRQDKSNPLIPKAIRYIVRNKTYDKYINTQEITYALFALSEYLVSAPQNKNMSAKVSLNNQNILDAFLTKDKQQESVTKDMADFIGKNNEVTIEKRDGEGNVYYDIVMKYFLPILEIAPRNNGITVQREYFAMNDDRNEKPIQNAKVGDTLKGKLTIIVPKERNFVVIESHLPAGFEGVNANLDTAQQAGVQDKLNKSDKDIWGDTYWRNLWYFNHTEIRDDKVVLFADYLPAGLYEYEYAVNVTSAGTFSNPPAFGYEMYFPEVFGRSRGEIINVGR